MAKQLAAQRLLGNLQRGADDPDVDRALPCLDPDLIDDISRTFATVTEGDTDERLIAGLNRIVGEPAEIEAAVIVWVDLLDLLVESTETRYPKTGRGDIKKQEVKGVVVYLLNTGRFEIPQLPGYMQPVVVDVIADFTVDVVVKLANEYHLWAVNPAPGITPADVWGRFKRALARVLRPIAAPFGWLGSRIYLWLRHPARLSPALRRALAAVERDGKITKGKTPFERTIELLLWMGQNRDALLALVHLVALVSEEVEQFAELESQEKKACARQLVLLVLDDCGLVPRSDLLLSKVEMAIDVAIEAVVYLFHKRKRFTHVKPRRQRFGPAAAIAAPPPPAAATPASRASRRVEVQPRAPEA